MDKSKAEITMLVLFSLLTAGIGQALMLTSAPSPNHQSVAVSDRSTRFARYPVSRLLFLDGPMALAPQLCRSHWPDAWHE